MQLPSLQKPALSMSSKTLSDKFEKIKYLATAINTHRLQGSNSRQTEKSTFPLSEKNGSYLKTKHLGSN
jgi:hypothetical protein